MTQPKVTAIVPVFNNEGSLRVCLQSLAEQTYGNFEAIVVDDGSTDASPDIARAFCAKDERFRFIGRGHTGVSSARNAGLAQAGGQYVAFIDADDIVPLQSFEFMHQTTVINYADTVCGIYERVDGVTARKNRRSYHLANKARRIQPDDFDLIHSWSLCNKWLSLRVIQEHRLQFEEFAHLEDAVFLYRYLAHAKHIFTCPHVVYRYRKPLPLDGRSTTQSARLDLLQDAVRALSELHLITAGYGPRFSEEMDYRFINTPLIGDYYRRLWTADDRFATVLSAQINGLFARLDDSHRQKLLHAQADILGEHGVRTKGALLAHPEIAVIVEEALGASALPVLLYGLYDQAAVSFEVLVPESLYGAVPDDLRPMSNLHCYRGDADQAFAMARADFVAFADMPMVYDHRSLSVMAKTLRRSGGTDCVSLPVVTRRGEPVRVPDGALGNRLFRAEALRTAPAGAHEAACGMTARTLKTPVVVSLGADATDSEGLLPAAFQARLSAVAPKKGGRTPTSSFYLNLDVDPNLVVVEGLGKRPRGSSLYVIQELQKPEYGELRIAFSVTKETKAQAKAVFKQRGFKRVSCVVAGSDAYKRALFSAGVLFNEVDFPNWWIKKPHQVYVNIWHGTPLKKLGRAKGGIIHKDANASRNFTMADYVLCANEYSIDHILGDCDVLGLTHARAVMLGYPRTGQLFDEALRRRVRQDLGLEGKRVYAWMPTYRDYLNAETAQSFLSQVDAMLADDQVLYVNLHHKTAARVSYEGLRHVRAFPAELDTYEFLCGVDALVTDYSSIMFDFAVARRKIVLYCPDRRDYEESRGLYRSVANLPFPVVDTVADLVRELGEPKEYDDDAFLREFNAYDSPENVQKLCRLAVCGQQADVEVRRLDGDAPRPTFIVSDGLAPGPATNLLYDLAERRAFGNGVRLSFLEQEVDKHLESAYPLVEQVPLYATKGKPIGERLEEQRLYNDLDPRAVIVVDTASVKRVRCFARFDSPVYLFIQPELASKARQDQKALKALKLFAQWGNGLFAMDEAVAAEMGALLDHPVEVVRSADQFIERFLR